MDNKTFQAKRRQIKHDSKLSQSEKNFALMQLMGGVNGLTPGTEYEKITRRYGSVKADGVMQKRRQIEAESTAQVKVKELELQVAQERLSNKNAQKVQETTTDDKLRSILRMTGNM